MGALQLKVDGGRGEGGSHRLRAFGGRGVGGGGGGSARGGQVGKEAHLDLVGLCVAPEAEFAGLCSVRRAGKHHSSL